MFAFEPSTEIERRPCFYKAPDGGGYSKTSFPFPRNIHPDTEDKLRPEMATSGELHALDSKNGLRSVNVACKLMGTFGEHLKSIKAVAKRIHLEYSPSKVKSVTNQLWLLQSQANKNPYIVSYYGSFYEDQDGKPSDLWLLFERMDCDLRHYLNHLKRYDGMEKERKRDFRHVSSFMVQMLRALDFLHSNGIVHGGIRPEKIGLQKQQYTLKLLSFGASRKNALTGKPMRSECPEYDPPETLLEENVNSKMDIWATGVCAVEFLGISPFTLEHPENYHRSVSSLATWKQILARYTDVAPETNILSAGIIENTSMNFEKLHAKIPYHRLGEDVGPLTVAAFRQILESILVINPSRRSSAAECLKMEFLSEMNRKYEMDEQVASSSSSLGADPILLLPATPNASAMHSNWMEVTTKFGKLSIGSQSKQAVFRRPNSDHNSKALDEFTFEAPPALKPDKDDKFFRPRNLNDQFHVIARGTYADIIAAKLLAKGQDGGVVSVAIRRYSMARLSSTVDGHRRVKREVDIAHLKQHENIVKFYGTWPEPPTGTAAYFCIITERMDHTLEKYFEHLKKKDESDQPVKRDIRHLGAMLTQILQAVDFLHSNGIIHRDITPRNIGMNQKEFVVKLLDFGLARDILPNNDYTINVDTPPIYKAPEALVQEKYDTGVDIWATALVTIEMLGLKLMMPPESDRPEKGASVDSVLNRMRDVFPDHEPLEKLSELWETKTGQPAKQPHLHAPNQSLKNIFNTLELRIGDNIGPLTKTDFFDLLTQMLTVNKTERPPASELLKHRFLHILYRKLRERADKARARSLDAENLCARAELINPGTFPCNSVS